MSKTKKPHRSYEAQAGSPLDGLRLVQQRPPRPVSNENDSPPPGERRAPAKGDSHEVELIKKLIHFFESI